MGKNQEKKWCVYKHTNKINGKIYIGQTCKVPQQRWANGEGYQKCTLFYKAIQKYGWDNFEHEIVKKDLTHEEADNEEKFLIACFESNKPDKGYNLTSGGEGAEHSETTKQKMRDNQKGELNTFFGRKHSLETIEKMKQAHTGVHPSLETRKKLSESKMGKLNPFFEKDHSEEFKDNLRKRLSKKVLCVETGMIFNSAKEAGELLNIDSSCINKCCRGERKTAGGYHWKRIANDDNNIQSDIKAIVAK